MTETAQLTGQLAAQLVARLAERGQTIALAESLTGGLVAAALIEIPGASAVVRGGVIAYQDSVKAAALGVDPDTLRASGPVSAEVAAQMATGAQVSLEPTPADWALATTGVAGPDPDPSAGAAPGTVFVAACGPSGDPVAKKYQLAGSRQEIRRETVRLALELLEEMTRVG